MNYSPKIDAVTKLINDNLKLPHVKLDHTIVDGKYKGRRIEDIYPELKTYTIKDRFPDIAASSSDEDWHLEQLYGHPRKNNVGANSRIPNKQVDGLFVEELTGIDASNVHNSAAEKGWLSPWTHMRQIIANIEKSNLSTMSM